MAALEVTILRKNRQQETLSVDADPDDSDELARVLAGWLEGNGWHEGRWGEFSAEVRHRGGLRVIARVRAA